jgi:hypothetical protein
VIYGPRIQLVRPPHVTLVICEVPGSILERVIGYRSCNIRGFTYVTKVEWNTPQVQSSILKHAGHYRPAYWGVDDVMGSLISAAILIYLKLIIICFMFFITSWQLIASLENTSWYFVRWGCQWQQLMHSSNSHTSR